MSREWNGTSSDLMTYESAAAGGTGFNMAYGTVLVVAKILTSGTAWLSFLEKEDTSTNTRMAFGRSGSNEGYMATDAGTSIATELLYVLADGWTLYAATKAAGSAIANIYKIPLGGSTSTGTGDPARTDCSTSGTNVLHIGGDDDPANMRLAVAAIFANDVLSQSELETIASAKTTQSILDAGATWCVDDGTTSNAFEFDLVGSNDRTAITGTSDSTDDPTDWVYLGAAAGASQRFMWMP